MISMLVAGFHFSDLKFINWCTHTPPCAFAMLFMTKISSKHRLFLTDWLSCVFISFFALLDSATATCQQKHTSTKIFHQKTFLIFPVCVWDTTHLQIELNFTAYFYFVVLRHTILMIIHETKLLPKDRGAITSVLRFRYFLTFTFFLCLSQHSFPSRPPQDINVKLLCKAAPLFWPLERLSTPATTIMYIPCGTRNHRKDAQCI